MGSTLSLAMRSCPKSLVAGRNHGPNCSKDNCPIRYLLNKERNGEWPEFQTVCDLVLEKVVPRLLEPLQSEGRSIKPCLAHGNLWNENTATDMDTGEPFVFDASSMYGIELSSIIKELSILPSAHQYQAHNEYEIGN